MTAESCFDTILDAFDRSWSEGTTPSIDLALQDVIRQSPRLTSDERCNLLARLITLDLQHRWRRHKHVDTVPELHGDGTTTVLFSADMLLEAYLDRFSELQGRPEVVRKLIAAEYRARRSSGERPEHAEYERRFPDYPQVVEDLRVVDHDVGSPQVLIGEAPYVRLAITAGPHTGESLLIDRFETILVGRSRDAHLQLDRDAYFSRFHFRLEINPPDCRLLDLQSANGTLVNRQRVTEAFLKDGDEISGGQTRIVVTTTPQRKTLVEIPSTREKAALPPTMVDGQSPVEQPELTRVGKYEIRRELGRGGMGVVYEAVQLSTQRKVALKLITPAGPVSEHAMGLFVREASILAQLKHPRIIESVEFGLHDHQFFLAMEFIETVDLAEIMKTQSRPSQIRVACGIVSRILEALEFAHQRGIVHRDVKPANILTFYVGKKLSAKLTDFGLAKNYKNVGFSAISDDEDMKGTLAYIAPEQIVNCRYAKPPCDIYSTAASLYFFLTGCTTHDFDDGQSAIATLLNKNPVPIHSRDPGIPARLARAVDRALARNPEDRFDTAREFHQALAEFARRKHS